MSVTADAVATTASLLVERVGHTMVLTINRAEARNAIDLAVTTALGDAMDEAERDCSVRCVILTGSGDKAFCAGADLKAIARGENLLPQEEPRKSWGFAGFASHHIRKPTIAAVNGFALGGGTELVLASDIALSVESASFGLPEVKRGIIAGAGGVFRLPSQLPRKIAMEMIFTGAPVTSARAHELHLINHVVPDGTVLDRALELAEQINANAPLAVQASKIVAYGIDERTLPSEARSWEISRRERATVNASADAKEGPRAFAEKRPPEWQAR
jgi:crotonobetainyl-CoA hydratase